VEPSLRRLSGHGRAVVAVDATQVDWADALGRSGATMPPAHRIIFRHSQFAAPKSIPRVPGAHARARQNWVYWGVPGITTGLPGSAEIKTGFPEFVGNKTQLRGSLGPRLGSWGVLGSYGRSHVASPAAAFQALHIAPEGRQASLPPDRRATSMPSRHHPSLGASVHRSGRGRRVPVDSPPMPLLSTMRRNAASWRVLAGSANGALQLLPIPLPLVGKHVRNQYRGTEQLGAHERSQPPCAG
jgi:hypothetical protein